MGWWTQLTKIEHPDPHTRRRGRLLTIVLLAMIALALLTAPSALLDPAGVATIGVILISIASFVAALLLAQRGFVTGAGWLFLVTFGVAIMGTIAGGGTLVALFFLVLSVIVAGLVLPPAQIWLVLLLALSCDLATLLFRPSVASDAQAQLILLAAGVLTTTAAMLAYLGAQAVQAALLSAEGNAQAARLAQAGATQQAHQLAEQAATLRHTERQLHDLVATLETPTVALAEGVLLAPLVGAMGSERARTLTRRLLDEIAAQRVQLLILDIAGVPLIDTDVAQTLVQITQAVRLLGCRVVLTGIAANVAVTLTHLGTDLAGVETARSPRDVLAAQPGSPDTRRR
jgi:rsbT co-antagonist protein RsbR